MGALSGIFAPAFPDSKQIHRALFGVTYEEDIYEKLCQRLPRLMRAFRWRIDPEMRRRNLLFVHVPRAAGTSISSALFGTRNTLHHSARYYKVVAPRFYQGAESFAVLRDPFERFISSYAFVRAGGTATCELSAVFRAETAHIRTVDDYLDYLEQRDVMQLDFVMRPQSWFVCDLESGHPLVDELFVLGEPELARFMARHGVAKLPWLNPSGRIALLLSLRQKARIHALYWRDFELVALIRNQRAREAEDFARIAGIAAE